MMVTSLSLTAEFISNDTDSSAFIYGLMSFTDKLLNGVGRVIYQGVLTTDQVLVALGQQVLVRGHFYIT